MIVFNLLLRSRATWRERLRWLVALPLVILAAHVWLEDRSWLAAVRTTAGSSFFFAAALARFASNRLEFHRADGVRAADALRAGPAWGYLIVVIALGLLCAAAVIALLDRRVLTACMIAMAAGLVAGSLVNVAAGFAVPRRAFTIAVREASAWLKRPPAGLAVAAAFAIVAVWAGATFKPQVALGIIASASFACGFALTSVNAEIVRFMAQSGFPVWRTLRANVIGLLVFAPFAALAAFAGLGIAGAGVVAGAAAIVASILCLRVLTYRLYDKHAADLATSLIVAGLGMVAALLPPIAPAALGVVIFPLWRRARASTWLLTA